MPSDPSGSRATHSRKHRMYNLACQTVLDLGGGGVLGFGGM